MSKALVSGKSFELEPNWGRSSHFYLKAKFSSSSFKFTQKEKNHLNWFQIWIPLIYQLNVVLAQVNLKINQSFLSTFCPAFPGIEKTVTIFRENSKIWISQFETDMIYLMVFLKWNWMTRDLLKKSKITTFRK